MSEEQQQPKRKSNKWLTLVSIPIQMGIIVFLFSWVGGWLDTNYPNKHHIWIKIMTLLGVAIAFYNLNRQLKDINNG